MARLVHGGEAGPAGGAGGADAGVEEADAFAEDVDFGLEAVARRRFFQEALL